MIRHRVATVGRPGPACGGCDWQHLGYPAQLLHKAALVRDCVERKLSQTI